MRVPVVGSRRVVPVLIRYFDKKNPGKKVPRYKAKEPLDGGRELRRKRKRRRRERIVGRKSPRRRFFTVASF